MRGYLVIYGFFNYIKGIKSLWRVELSFLNRREGEWSCGIEVVGKGFWKWKMICWAGYLKVCEGVL